MASRLDGLALSTLGVPRAEDVDEAFARACFLVAKERNGEKRSDRIVVIYDESHPFAVEIQRSLRKVPV